MTASETADRILAGEVRAAARLMRDIDDDQPEALEALKLLYGRRPEARVVGVTGSPGVGKSTLTDVLVRAWRARGLTVGVVAVDPTSPFSGGAILGDRVRMQAHATDEGVFIRSLATRGHFGGLTASTRGIITVMEAMGKDLVVVETVGVGQDEVEIVAAADTTLVVTVPGMGDDIQAIKAGILEVGDIFVVNKMDRDGAERTVSELRGMLSLGSGAERRGGWEPPVVPTSAMDGRGLPELVEAIEAHEARLAADGGRLRTRRRTQRRRREILELVQARLMRRLMDTYLDEDELDQLALAIERGETDPYSVCERVLARSLSF